MILIDYQSLYLRSIFNNLELRFIWLPNILIGKIKYPEDANKIFDLIIRKSKKI